MYWGSEMCSSSVYIEQCNMTGKVDFVEHFMTRAQLQIFSLVKFHHALVIPVEVYLNEGIKLTTNRYSPIFILFFRRYFQ